MENSFEKWIKEFMEGWKKLDYEKVLALFSPSVKYYETPLDEPCQNFEEVTKLWEVVKSNQKDISYKYEIIASKDNNFIVNFQMTRTLVNGNIKQNIDGIFEIKLDDYLEKCIYFKQWHYTK